MSSYSSETQAYGAESLLGDPEEEPPSPGHREPLSTQLRLAPRSTSALTSTPSETEQGKGWFLHEDGTPRRHSERIVAFRKRYFSDVAWSDWNDWHWQLAHRVRTLQQLERYLTLDSSEYEALSRPTLLPFAVTPYYLALLDPENPRQSLRRSVVPTTSELLVGPGESDDPLAENSHTAAPGLVHRYPDRVLFLAVDQCTTYCRYCTRSRVVGSNELTAELDRWKLGLEYVRKHPEIRDVLVSGGDPLSMSDERLDWLLTELRRIPHVEFLRLGTKTPAVLPQRITKALTRMLKKHHPLWMSLHFIHPNECTAESRIACERLADAGIPLGAQTVLLKGVNDEVDTLKRLLQRLLTMRVRPYYLYQCDPINGSSHFRTSVDRGIELIGQLRGHTSGYAVPTYIIDAPGGGGKIPLGPEYFVGRSEGAVLLRNFEGKPYRYPEDDANVQPSEPAAARKRLHLRTAS